MPSLYNITAEYDVLRDEGKAFSEAVKAAGVAVEHHHFDNAAHGFACSGGPSDDFKRNMANMVSWLQKL